VLISHRSVSHKEQLVIAHSEYLLKPGVSYSRKQRAIKDSQIVMMSHMDIEKDI